MFKRIFPELIFKCKLDGLRLERAGAQEIHFKLLYAAQFPRFGSASEPPKPMNLKFKTLVYIFSTGYYYWLGGRGDYIIVSQSAQDPVVGYYGDNGKKCSLGLYRTKRNDENLLSIFSLPYKGPTGEEHVYLPTDCASKLPQDLFCVKLEVYEVIPCCTEISPPAHVGSKNKFGSVRISTLSNCVFSLFDKTKKIFSSNKISKRQDPSNNTLNSSVCKLIEDLKLKSLFYEKEISYYDSIAAGFEKELSFISKYFANCWKINNGTGEIQALKDVFCVKKNC
jgi:hypothetical protein